MAVREIVRHRSATTSLGIVDGTVASVRAAEQTETAVRVYDGGFVGVASAIGPADEEELASAATDALTIGITHPGPVRDQTSDTTHAGEMPDADAFVGQVESFLAPLRKRWPTFVYSNRVTAEHSETTLQNEAGVRHRHALTGFGMGLVLKERGSPNIIDGILMFEGPAFDAEGMLDTAAPWLEAWNNPIAGFEAGQHTVVFVGFNALSGKFRTELLGRRLATGASMFSAKRGERVFSERFSLVDSHDAKRHRVLPFDLEGSLRAEPDLRVIDAGVVQLGAASLRDAAQHGIPGTASATGPLRSLPMAQLGLLEPTPTAGSLSDLLDGPAILVQLSAGGDANEAGELGLPAQVAWQIDRHGRPIARLPQLMISGNLYRMFGDDYVGTTSARVSPFADAPYVAVRAEVALSG